MITKESANSLMTDTQKYFESKGLKIKRISARYSNVSCRISIEVTDNDTKELKKEWDRFCGMYGLLPEHYNKEIYTPKGLLKIQSINTRKRKNPISLMGKDGKSYCCDANYVKYLLNSRK